MCRGCTCIGGQSTTLDVILQDAICHGFAVVIGGVVVDGVCVVLFFEIGSLHWPETC